MVWLTWVWIDFPLGIAAMYASEMTESNSVAVTLVAVIGGLQWVLWGMLIEAAGRFLRWVSTKK